MKLLIIEDERQLSDSIVSYMSHEDYLCEQAFSFREAKQRVELYEYDCILLDLMLPGGSGLDMLPTIKRHQPQAGIIIESAKDALNDKIEGLRRGADDYLAKPFHLPELSMRIFALLRRKCFHADNVIRSGNIAINLPLHQVIAGDNVVDLTRSEYELLLFLVENRHRIVSKSAVAEHLTGDMADMLNDYSFVYAHIKNLKAKLNAAGAKDCIKTFYGTGYKWNVEE